ncbi:molybdopterin-guanine dinucleotide biosynthesis protein B [Candidatus Latescibacterota bacterium]
MAGINSMLENLPILGICGFSGAGKTTLIEKLIPLLSAKGLKIAVVKHDAHRIVVDTPGKDSDRLFKSGADVFLQGQTEDFLRLHTQDENELFPKLRELTCRYDLVLIEGRKEIPVQKMWLLSDSENVPPRDIDGIISVLSRDIDRAEYMLSFFDRWLSEQLVKTPVYGCVLIGGKSSRMGKPKHLIADDGETWLEKIAELLKPVTQKIVISGAGVVPEELSGITRIPDVPNIKGPMAGILSSMRWEPYSSWLVVSCDLPDLSKDALKWLLSTRKPGVWATLPRLSESDNVEPLLAHYDFRAHHLLEKLAFDGEFSPSHISYSSKVINTSPPEGLTAAWNNINTNEERISQIHSNNKR